MKMTHTNRALAKLNYSFHCSYAARHILFSAPPPGSLSPADEQLHAGSAAMSRGCHRSGGTGTPLPCLTLPCRPPLCPNPPEPPQTRLTPSPPPTDPSQPRGRPPRGTEPPLWPPAKSPAPAATLLRSRPPGSCSLLAVTVAPLGLAPHRPRGGADTPGRTGAQQRRAARRGGEGRGGSKCHGL